MGTSRYSEEILRRGTGTDSDRSHDTNEAGEDTTDVTDRERLYCSPGEILRRNTPNAPVLERGVDRNLQWAETRKGRYLRRIRILPRSLVD